MRLSIIPALLAALLCLPLLASPAHAQKAAKASAASSPTSSKEQAEGIISGVVDNMWEYTDHYFHDGDYNRIISLCRIIVEAEPSFDEAYENAAYLLWSQGDSGAADDILQHGLKNSKNQLSLLFEFGRHLMTTNRPDAALPYLEKAAAMPNAGPLVYAQLGHCYEKNKKYKEAVKTWETVVKRFPDFPTGKKNLDHAKTLAANETK